MGAPVIRGIGAGINEVGMMPRFLDMVGLDFFLVALRYTLMEQEVLEVEFPYCERMSVGVVVGGVYNSGITATGPVPAASRRTASASSRWRRNTLSSFSSNSMSIDWRSANNR